MTFSFRHLGFALLLIDSGTSTADSPPPAAVNAAPVALLVDLGAGQTLYAGNAEKRFLPASMTKAMSALIAFDMIAAGELKEDARITVRPETARRWAGKGTTLSLRPDESISVHDLLMGMTTVSANDAAVVLAEGAAGNKQSWVARMNTRARALGMTSSHFETPSGFPDHRRTYVNARDLVRLAQALIRDHPQLYRRYFGHRVMEWRGQQLTSHDPFAQVFPGADGIKTGHSFEAGFNFLGSVERGGRRLVLVIGGARTEPDRANAAKALAEWGYAAWDSRPLAGDGWIAGHARVQSGDTRQVGLALPRRFTFAVPKGTNPNLSARIVYQGPVPAPIKRGSVIAGLEVTIEGQPPHYLPLIATRDVDRAGPFDRLVNGLLGLFS